MDETLADMLAVGGKSNSLGRTDEVIKLLLNDRSRVEELCACMFNSDAWIRMRAADALEKICREQPTWLLPFVDTFILELHNSAQPSIQWHLAQIYRHITLSPPQLAAITGWLTRLISTKDVDWITSANAMDTLMHFWQLGHLPKAKLLPLLHVQQHHKSNAVIKRANKLIKQIEE